MDVIRVSIGTAGVLGLAQVPMAVAPTTAYLMLGGRCALSCAFCAQARGSEADEQALSRVAWPAFPLRQVCARLGAAEGQRAETWFFPKNQVSHADETCPAVRRCCIQVTTGPEAYRQALEAIGQVRRATALPLDVAILPADMAQVAGLIAAGVDHLGFGLDAASKRVFQAVKGAHWDRMLDMIAQTAARFGGHAAVHLIVGLGETERELVERIVWAHEQGVEVGLFAFTPVRGTPLADRPPPPLAQYRRMQAARWLIVRCGAGLLDFAFGPGGVLAEIGPADWPMRLADGEAFRTSGCPDCNRPFYNERPGGPMYNYPRPLKKDEIDRAMEEVGLV